MTLVVIFGPPAAGKMTVGIELERLTGLRLFHNHMSIDPVLQFFDFGTPAYSRLVGEFRRRIFEEVAASELPGLVFTYVWALDDPRDKGAIDDLARIFTEHGASVCYAELEATQAERLRRNETPLRLSEKRTKRNLERSREQLLKTDARYRMNSDGDSFYPDRHLKVENTKVAPTVVARRIAEHFGIQKQAAD